MLRSINLRNFKAWRELNVELGHVTGFFGANSSGKSSIIQFLLMLKETKNATDRSIVIDFGSQHQLVNLGSYRNVVFSHEEENNISWSIHWKLDEKLVIHNPSGNRRDVLASGETLGLQTEITFHDHAPSCNYLKYSIESHEFLIRHKKDNSTEFELVANSPERFRFVRNQSRAWSLPGPIKTHLFPDQAKTYFQNSNFLAQFEYEYESLMNSIYYLGPLREHPRREYSWSGTSPTDVGTRGERTVEAILAATNRGETRNRGGRTHYKPFQEIIAYWLKQIGLIESFSIEEIGKGANLYRALVRRDARSPEALLTDVGFGVSQVLPALVLLQYVPEGSIVIMEQPEIHLHPSVQSGLADAILDISRSRNLQIIIESHSEHILRRMQRRVAEEEFEFSNLKLFFCENSSGESTIHDLKLNSYGEIGNWPKDFFGDEMTEISETRKSALRRKIKDQSNAISG